MPVVSHIKQHQKTADTLKIHCNAWHMTCSREPLIAFDSDCIMPIRSVSSGQRPPAGRITCAGHFVYLYAPGKLRVRHWVAVTR